MTKTVLRLIRSIIERVADDPLRLCIVLGFIVITFAMYLMYLLARH
jgi:short subunit fatty acids transporter